MWIFNILHCLIYNVILHVSFSLISSQCQSSATVLYLRFHCKRFTFRISNTSCWRFLSKIIQKCVKWMQKPINHPLIQSLLQWFTDLYGKWFWEYNQKTKWHFHHMLSPNTSLLSQWGNFNNLTRACRLTQAKLSTRKGPESKGTRMDNDHSQIKCRLAYKNVGLAQNI